MSKTKAKGKTAAKAATPAPAPESAPAPEPPAYVSCVLGPRSPAGRLTVGNAAIEPRKPGRIPRAEFDRLRAEYDLVEVEG